MYRHSAYLLDSNRDLDFLHIGIDVPLEGGQVYGLPYLARHFDDMLQNNRMAAILVFDAIAHGSLASLPAEVVLPR